MSSHWSESRYTGLFSRFGELPGRAFDPDVLMVGAQLPAWSCRTDEIAIGGAGLDLESARGACFGEALERYQPYPLPQDRQIETPFAEWPLPDPVVAPDRWVLFSDQQYRSEGFPYRPLTAESRIPWVSFREASTGEPRWVPSEMAYLFHAPGRPPRLCPAISTGLSAGAPGTVLLRGVQEIIERDALMGAWWGKYPVQEWQAARVLPGLPPGLVERVLRPNLCYRFYHLGSPFSGHATLVTVAGEDTEGWSFSVGSACRETRSGSWAKSILEAIQSRHYVRYLRKERPAPDRAMPRGFDEHAAYYSFYPERLKETVLEKPAPATTPEVGPEGFSELAAKLGPGRPVLFRNMTPPGIAAAEPGACVLRVLVPGLQPLHGHHGLAHLGGPLWGARPLADWERHPPHPCP